jgi:hypothetical protein
MKKILLEQVKAYQGDLKKEYKALEVRDPFLRRAVDARCFDQKLPIVNYDVTNPVNGKPSIQVLLEDKMIGFPSSDPSKKYPGYYLMYAVTGKSGSYELVKTIPWKCERMNHKESIEAILQEKLKYKPFSAVTGGDVVNHILVDVLEDENLQPNGKYYDYVQGIQSHFEALKPYGMPLLMWKPNVALKDVKDEFGERERLINYFKNQGYEDISISVGEEDEYYNVDLGKLYPDKGFKPGYKLYKSKSNVSTGSKLDCYKVLDSYYDDARKKKDRPMKEILVDKANVKACINNDKWPLFYQIQAKQKIEYLNGLYSSSSYNLRESTDRLTNVIRESLRIVKSNKNRNSF